MDSLDSYDSRETLLAKTIRLLKHRDRTLTYSVLARQVGCSPAFLSSLVSDSPPDHPSVDTIQRLYEVLAGSELKY